MTCRRRLRGLLVALGAALIAVSSAPAAPAAPAAGAAAAASAAARSTCPAAHPLTQVRVQTVPEVPGARLKVGGSDVVTDRRGRADVEVCRLSRPPDVTGPPAPVELSGRRRAIYDKSFLSDGGRLLQVAFRVENEVSFTFAGLPSRQIESFTVRSSGGELVTRTSLDPVYLLGTRVFRGPDGPEARRVYYTVDAVQVAGSSVVHRSQLKFYPADRAVVRVPLLAFTVRVQVVDRLFRMPTGRAVRLTRPGEVVFRQPLEDGAASFSEVPRGRYEVVAEAPGLRIGRTLLLSRDQVVVMPVLTWLDLLVLVGVPLGIAIALVLAPRPSLRLRLARAAGRPFAAAGRLLASGPTAHRGPGRLLHVRQKK